MNEKSILEENDSILANDLISSLKTALSLKKYLEVIRIGSALSKPFFISGNYKARLSIGILVEEAAASINDEKTQMIELIDSIGWMQVELGDLENGEKNIRHGLQYAQKNEDKFYISKANRHIGAIYRRKEEYKLADIFYEKSINIAHEIEDRVKKTEAIAATNYAQALLFFHTKDFCKANHFIEHSIVKFIELNICEKAIMASTTKAQIYLAQGHIKEAKDLFRTSLHDAELRTLRLEMTRCYIGLAKVYIKENNWSKSKEYLDKSEETEKYIQTASEIAEIRQLRVILSQKTNTA